ncbi:uncharacterized protein LOC106080136 [Biomphalaria glabrata]|uniref:Uncharacterized protein LOC106080136 n=1 Tax=Biomphalaria glabrata TaxID=6526 RepID=A0A9U8EP75_BIOGL|nr:uncharacterized protein LOC106080136 [Biomphalaria glabrata]
MRETKADLSQLQQESTLAFLPALLYLSLLMVTGSIGNCLVLIVYCTKISKTPLRVFIMGNTVVDFLIMVIVIPGEIYELFHFYDFDWPIVCKIRKYLTCILIMSSASFLVVIAITRYKMVCSPAEKQVTMTQSKRIIVLLIFNSLILSIPYFVLHGTQTIKTPFPNLDGHSCQLDDLYVNTIWPKVNSALFCLIFMICTVAMVTAYVRIARKIWTHKIAKRRNEQRRMKPAQRHSVWFIETSTSPVLGRKNATPPRGGTNRDLLQGIKEINNSNSDTAHLNNVNKKDATSATSAVNSHGEINQAKVKTFDRSKILGKQRLDDCRTNSLERYTKSMRKHRSCDERNKNALSNSWTVLTTLSSPTPSSIPVEKKTSFLKYKLDKRRSIFSKTSCMMLTISLTSFLGALPFLALHVYKVVCPENYAALHGVQLAFFQLFCRSHLFNSAVNPIVYIQKDKNLRRECLKLFKRS